jgi:hypothetical protein
MMSFFEIPPGVLKKLDTIRYKFFWEGDSHKKKYHLAKWDILYLPKDQGGMGITNLHIKNICLLSKWLYRLLNEEGVWQQLLINKYFSMKSLTQTQGRPGDSHFWAGLMKVKDDFLKWGHFLIQDGSKTRFWKDVWLESMPLSEQLWFYIM